MLIKLHISELLFLPSKVKTTRKPLTFQRRVFFDRLVIAGIYLAGIITAIVVS